MVFIPCYLDILPSKSLTFVQYDGCFVKSSGWFENTECLFIAMEYFPLGDLQKYMTQLFREREAQQITFQLLESLDFMHSNGFTHGDLKPQVCSSHGAFDSTLLILRRTFLRYLQAHIGG